MMESHQGIVKESEDTDASNKHDEEPVTHNITAVTGHYLEPENLNTIPVYLSTCHMIAALFQTLQSIILFYYSSQVTLKWMVYTNFPVVDEEMRDFNGNDSDVTYYTRPDSKHTGGYYITWMTGGFILLNALDNILCVTPKVIDWYEYYLRRSQSPFRWAEYAISAPLMKMHIAQVAGITDSHTLFLIFVLNHASMYFCLCHEILNAKARADGYKQNWLPFIFGCVPYIACWLVIFCYFFETLSRGQQPPGFVFGIVITLFLVEMLFPVCFILQWKKIGKFQDYIVGEYSFIILSVVAKTILAWTTLLGANSYVDNYYESSEL